MKALNTLVLMQLKDKLNLSFLQSKKSLIFKVVFAAIKFAVITAIVYYAFHYVSFLRLTSLYSGINTNFFAIVFSIMLVLSLITCTYGLTKWLYLSRDNQVLLTMPASRTTVFASKWIVYYIYEFLRNLTYIVPILIAYGLVNQMNVGYYFWLLPVNILITLLTMSVGALLSIPMLFLIMFTQRFKPLKYIFVTVISGLIIWAIIYFIGLIPENLNIMLNWGTIFWDIQDFLNAFAQKWIVLYALTIAFVGKRVGTANRFFFSEQLFALLWIALAIVAAVGLTILIIRPLFFKMTSSPFEFTKTAGLKSRKNKQHSAFVGVLKKDVLSTVRSGDKFGALVIISIVMPLAILLLNKLFNAMDTRLAGAQMALAFNILIILLIALASNGNVSKIYSQEARAAYLNKTAPEKYYKILLPRLLINLAFINAAIIASSIIFAYFQHFNVQTTIMVVFSLCFVYSGHLFWSASLDIMNPQNEHYATAGEHTNNPNEIKSTLMAFLISALFTYAFFFLIKEQASVAWVKLLCISVAYVAWNVWMFFSKVKLYYEEK